VARAERLTCRCHAEKAAEPPSTPAVDHG
jgi:hypothetical protein